MAEIRIGLHLHPPPKQSLEAFTDMVRRADRYGLRASAPATRSGTIWSALLP
jgi:hypothetical protein